MTFSPFAFHRTELAIDLLGSLTGKGLFDASSGLFLAAPRRTGKSTFLREDLTPQIEKQNWIAIYVDLWADPSRDPAALISDALIDAQLATDRPRKLAHSLGIKTLNIANMIQLDIGLRHERSTFSDKLADLNQKSGKPIVLIVDEAQHALNTPAGMDAMFALKAARDRLKNKLFLVFTGSHRDKLAHLVLKKDQPFFGAQITPFPYLGKPFTDAYTAWVNRHLASQNHFSETDMFGAFELVGHRPEMLKEIVKEVALDIGRASDFKAILTKNAHHLRHQIWSDIESQFATLSELQKTVIETLVQKGKIFSPFSEESMLAYQKRHPKTKFGPPQIQAALDGLREKNLVWRSARGAYALEDESLVQWFTDRTSLFDNP